MTSLQTKIMKPLFDKYMTFYCLQIMIILSVIGQNIYAQEQFLKPSDSIITEGVPQISKSEVANLFYNPSELKNNLIWDTDKESRGILVTDKTNDIYLLDSPLVTPVKLLDSIVPYSVKTRIGGGSFAYNFDVKKDDNLQLYLFEYETKASKQLTNLTGKNESIDSFVWSQDGKFIFFTKVDYDNKKTTLCNHNLGSENCFQVNLEGNWNVLDVDKDNVLLKYWKSAGSQYLYYYNIKTNKVIPIDDVGNSRQGFFVGNSILWMAEGNDICQQERCVISLNLKTNQKQKVNLPENLLNIYDIKISPNKQHLLVQESKEGIDYLRVFKLKDNRVVKEIPQFIFGQYVIWNTRWLSDKEIAYTLENVGKPASIQSYNLQSKKTTSWTKEKLPVQLENKITSPETIRWKSFDKKDITGFIIHPKSSVKKKHPVLINIHGGPQALDKPLFNSQDIMLSANLEMTIIHTNIRGSSGFTTEFVNADNQGKRGNAVKDMQALLDWIETQPDLDSSQIYLRGGSYGGFIVLSTALAEPNRIKGVIAEYPIVSIRGYLSQSWIGEFAFAEYGNPKDEKLMSELDQLTPLNNTKNWNNIPLLMTRGKLDSRTPEKDVIDLKTQLQNQGSEVWYILSTDSGHGVGDNYVFAAVFKFLKNQIKKEKKNE